MTLSPRDRKLLLVLGGAVAVFLLLQYVILPPASTPSTQPVAQSSDQLRQSVALLRQTAAALPVRESLLKQVDADLADREHGIIQAGTAAEAQSEVLQIAQRIGKSDSLDIRSGELSAPKTFGDYGLVYAGVSFDCQIEQLLNFLADLSRERELIVPSEEHITSGDPKKKTMTVRMVLAGVVAKKLIPEKKSAERVLMAMKPKLVALNAGLALGLVLIVWQGRVKWEDAQAERQASINVPVKHVTPPPMAPAQKPEAVQSAKYVDVATKNLFSKDRNPNVVIDPPKPEDVKVMPPLPVVYGVLGLPSGVKAIMAEHSGSPSKSVHAGEKIGEFQILALDLRKVKLEWNGKEIDRDLDELADHSGAAAAGAQSASTQITGPAVAAAQANKPATSASLGAETGTPDAPSRTCTASDTSPVGAVVDGYKKTGTATPFGVMNCSWVPNK